MIVAKFDFDEIDTLQKYYDSIYQQHKIAHGEHYMAVHHDLQTRMAVCKSYRELGVNQGATAACVLLTNPTVMEIYDWKLERYQPAAHLFEAYAKQNGVQFSAHNGNSTNPPPDLKPVDLTYIDTTHVASTLRKELAIYSKLTNEYIVCHDTAAKPDLRKVVDQFVESNDDWQLVQHNSQSVGYSVIGKVNA